MAVPILRTELASPKSRLSERAFFLSLMLATAAPLLWLGFGVPLSHKSTGGLTAALMPVIALTGIGHVGATAFFYFDREAVELISRNRLRFFLYPAIAAGGCLAASWASSSLWSVVLIAFLAWQFYHYQRQNYGLIAFAAQSSGGGKLPRELTWMLNLGAAAAVVRLTSTSEAALVLGIALFFGSTLMFVELLRSLISRRENWLVLTFETLGWLFFLPSLISTDRLIGFWSYAIAHGAQYLIFMVVISGNRRRGLIGLALFALAFAAVFIVFVKLNASGAGFAVYTGLVMGHFMIDAKVWRLREPLQRQIIGERFGFIFPELRPSPTLRTAQS